MSQRVFVGSYATENLPSAVEGDVVYDSTEQKLKVYDGSETLGLMAIKINGVTVIDDDRKGIFNKLNPGVYTTSQIDSLGSLSEGELVYDTTSEKLFIYDGSATGQMLVVVVEMD